MRFWIVLLLTLSFSLQGWASARAASVPCPMGEGMAVMVSEMTKGDEGQGSSALMAAEAAVDDCCNDTDTYLKTGKPCKTGQDCQTPAVALIVPVAAGTSGSHSVPVALSVSSRSPALVAVWRPPTSI